MLTNFFKNSKPINFLVSFFILGFFFLVFNIFSVSEFDSYAFLFKKIGIFLILLIAAYVLHFILIKEKSKGRHTYSIFLFSIFCISIGALLTSNQIIISGLFLILSLHRIIGMKTGMHLQKKIFDASFFIALASLFYPPIIIFMLLPYWGVLYFAHESYKNWYIPFVGIIAAFILQTSYNLLTADQFFNPLTHYSFDLIHFKNIDLISIIPGFLILIGTIWACFNIFSREVKSTQVQKKADLMMIWSLIISLVVLLFSDFENRFYESFLFIFINCALILGRYLEIPISKPKRIKEILLITLTLNSLCFAIISLWNMI